MFFLKLVVLGVIFFWVVLCVIIVCDKLIMIDFFVRFNFSFFFRNLIRYLVLFGLFLFLVILIFFVLLVLVWESSFLILFIFFFWVLLFVVVVMFISFFSIFLIVNGFGLNMVGCVDLFLIVIKFRLLIFFWFCLIIVRFLFVDFLIVFMIKFFLMFSLIFV